MSYQYAKAVRVAFNEKIGRIEQDPEKESTYKPRLILDNSAINFLVSTLPEQLIKRFPLMNSSADTDFLLLCTAAKRLQLKILVWARLAAVIKALISECEVSRCDSSRRQGRNRMPIVTHQQSY